MKVTWFHLMPYRWLPDDFRERYHRVWVDVHSRLYDPVRGHLVYNDYLDLLEYADTLGFDGIGVNEHHQNGYGLMPSPNLMAAALTRRTSRAALVVLGNSIALYNPPVRVAEEFAMLDVMSGGRLVTGFPVAPQWTRITATALIPAMVRGKSMGSARSDYAGVGGREPFAFNGRVHQAALRESVAAAVAAAAPADVDARSAVRWRRLGFLRRQQLSYSLSEFFRVQRAHALMRWLLGAGAVARRVDAIAVRAAFVQTSSAGRHRRRQWSGDSPHVDYFFNKLPAPFPGIRRRRPATARTSLPTVLSLQLRKRYCATWSIRSRRRRTGSWSGGYIIAGSPETVRQRFEELARSLNVGHLGLGLHMGSAPIDLINRGTQLFAEKVLPALRPIFNDWEDHWWSKALPADKRAAAGSANAASEQRQRRRAGNGAVVRP